MKKLYIFRTGLLACLFYLSLNTTMAQSQAQSLVQKQLEAFNARNLDSFLTAFSDQVTLYNFPHELNSRGKAALREIYGQMFQQFEGLRCVSTNRMQLGNKVFDHQRVYLSPGQPPLEVIVMYQIRQGTIDSVYFIYPD